MERFVDDFWDADDLGKCRVCSSLISHTFMFSKLPLFYSAISSSQPDMADEAYRTVHGMTYFGHRSYSVYFRFNTLIRMLRKVGETQFEQELKALRDSFPLDQPKTRTVLPDTLSLQRAGEALA